MKPFRFLGWIVYFLLTFVLTLIVFVGLLAGCVLSIPLDAIRFEWCQLTGKPFSMKRAYCVRLFVAADNFLDTSGRHVGSKLPPIMNAEFVGEWPEPARNALRTLYDSQGLTTVGAKLEYMVNQYGPCNFYGAGDEARLASYEHDWLMDNGLIEPDFG